MEILMHPIGIIHSPLTEKSQTPIQASRSQAKGVVFGPEGALFVFVLELRN
jgi:tRNA (Thr-GGU) A37 N-methylase